jgi:hypothetical protein
MAEHFRQLCTELLDELRWYTNEDAEKPAVIARARAALADPPLGDYLIPEYVMATIDAWRAARASNEPIKRKLPTDREILRLARDAGMCFPDCWNLDEVLDPENEAETQAWVAAATTESEKAARTHSALTPHKRMAELRAFAYSVRLHH